ncbi:MULTISPECIES: hypothetical protein [Flavobacterium]|uniref:hypothetical protein n=1 Tax=Flavobacterium TaxID=237 RepID=UPI0006FA03DD|nr:MULTISPECIES: hypothetical protein [Flavobacterium]KQS46645.1 hypothetical protein ASG38_12740 [Flavobacterium sp. Leaf359]MDQ7960748.1 hypothetical protein [Flavobacterium lindanitolerans]
MEKILLSTYLVKITKDKNDLVLSQFAGEEDFFNFCDGFFKKIFSVIQKSMDAKDSTTIHLSLDEMPIVDEKKRCIYGFLSSGVGGENYKIKDTDTNIEMFAVKSNHAAFRDVFFYLQIPKNKTVGALILQRKSRFGIKTAFLKGINLYSRNLGYQGFHIQINNVIHGQVYRKMINEGNLKKIEFIKRKIPKYIEQYYRKNGEVDKIPGTLKTTMSASKLPDNFKEFVDRLFSTKRNDRIELKDIGDDFEEIEFELELNGKKKTFYVAHRSRIQPDIDVSNEIERDSNGNPTIDSLVEQCDSLIKEVIYQ